MYPYEDLTVINEANLNKFKLMKYYTIKIPVHFLRLNTYLLDRQIVDSFQNVEFFDMLKTTFLSVSDLQLL